MLGEHLDADAWDNELSPESLQEELNSIVRNPNRKGNRIEIAAEMTARPANSCDRFNFALEGTCRDLSVNGIGTILKQPPTVGSFYWIDIDCDDLKFRTGIGRCIRCQYLREDAFEAGFEFVNDTSPQLEDTQSTDNSLL